MKYGFIGCGNMGGALARALSKSTKDIMLADFDRTKAEALANEIGAVVTDNKTIARECGRIFLGVKPQVMSDMLYDIKDDFNANAVLISMAAGLTTDRIKELFGDEVLRLVLSNSEDKSKVLL